MEPRPSNQPRSHRPADILVVENDPRIVELLAWFLARRGHRVRSAASFDEARGSILERRPDLMLSDVEMGTESARSALPRLSREGLLPPTLVISGQLDGDLVLELGAVPGVVGVMPKPFEFQRLEARIREHLLAGSAGPLGAGGAGPDALAPPPPPPP